MILDKREGDDKEYESIRSNVAVTYRALVSLITTTEQADALMAFADAVYAERGYLLKDGCKAMEEMYLFLESIKRTRTARARRRRKP